MKIGELSLRSGISVRMLRYYELEGLLKPNTLSISFPLTVVGSPLKLVNEKLHLSESDGPTLPQALAV